MAKDGLWTAVTATAAIISVGVGGWLIAKKAITTHEVYKDINFFSDKEGEERYDGHISLVDGENHSPGDIVILRQLQAVGPNAIKLTLRANGVVITATCGSGWKKNRLILFHTVSSMFFIKLAELCVNPVNPIDKILLTSIRNNLRTMIYEGT